MDRRTFLAGSALLAGLPGLALAGAATDRRLVLILLRGGLDGLAAVPPVGDPGYAALRPPVEGALPLQGPFSLHPGLSGLKPLWDRGELLVVHATATPYADRSHFDGQNVLECGAPTPFGAPSGWLNRALLARGDRQLALSLGTGLPLVLRGDAPASSLDPSHLPRVSDAVLAGVRRMYGDDVLLGAALDRGLATAALFEVHGSARSGETEILGRVLASADGPRIATLALDGWDTHTAQDGTLSRRLPELAKAIEGLRTGLGEAWASAAVVVVTEFGRTARPNGTDGTDHGIGGVALLAGGAVAGGRVVADWPGLGPKDLVDERDLRPTTDLRAVLKGVLRDHLGVATAALDREVFPDSGQVRPIDGLLHG